jgi:SAM-dependent methyltransferase
MVKTLPNPPAELRAITARTIEHYDRSAEAFREGTRDHDVSQNVAALLDHLDGTPPFTILDFGCGPGRDLRTFARLGHIATGLEGCASFVEMARSGTGCEVLHQDFLSLDLPAETFDGVFANASLFHVPSAELPRVLRELHATLKPRGALFSSNPRGNDEEGWSSGRYGAWHSLPAWQRYLRDAGFVEVLHYYRPPGLPREQQPWLAGLWRKA